MVVEESSVCEVCEVCLAVKIAAVPVRNRGLAVCPGGLPAGHGLAACRGGLPAVPRPTASCRPLPLAASEAH